MPAFKSYKVKTWNSAFWQNLSRFISTTYIYIFLINFFSDSAFCQRSAGIKQRGDRSSFWVEPCVGPTLGQNWANVSCLLGWYHLTTLNHAGLAFSQHWENRRLCSVHHDFTCCRRHQGARDVHPMSLQCWPPVYDVGPTLNRFGWTSRACCVWALWYQTLNQCWCNAGPPAQHYTNIGSMSSICWEVLTTCLIR